MVDFCYINILTIKDKSIKIPIIRGVKKLVYWIVALVIAITVHEFSHGYVSDRLGDPTPRAQGRLTLNPLKHLDLMGLLFLIFVGFGWAAPVKVDPRYYKDERKGLMLVALAGPLSNFAIAIISLIIGIVFNTLNIQNVVLSTLIESIVGINIMLGVFNLIPLPPLDGSKILAFFLPKGVKMDERIGFVILIILLLTGYLSKFLLIVYTPIMEVISKIL